MSLFGKNYEEFGSSDNDLILKTRGKIKIQWGNKLIDLLDKDGNVKSKAETIRNVSSRNLISGTGLFYTGSSLVASVGGLLINLASLADWNLTDSTKESFIKNKPTKLSLFINDVGFLTQNSPAGLLTSELLTKLINILETPLITLDENPSEYSDNPVKSKGIKKAIELEETRAKSIEDNLSLRISDLETGTLIDNKINLLDAIVSLTAGSDGLALSIIEVDGKITAISGSIAANTYEPYGTLNSLKGVAFGVAELDEHGIILSSQLPSYVDDVIEGYLYNTKFYKEDTHTTEISGESGKIYIDLYSEKTYRWGGSAFAIISETLALGETSSTAYRGDRGKIAYDHSQTAHAPSNAELNQNAFSNIVIGTTTIAANSKTDTLTLIAGTNITLSSSNKEITITATDTWRPIGTGANDACAGNDSRLSNSRPASDVYSWAKASTKPSYSYSEISGTPSSLPASDVYSWAKASTKPSYTLDEISDGSTRKLANYLPLAGGTLNGSIIFNLTSTTRTNGIIGTYDPNRAAAIWSMGSSYQIKADGTTFGSLYGAAYAYFGSGYTFGAGYSNGHSLVWCQGGSVHGAIGNSIWSRGGFIKNGSSDLYLLAGGGGHKSIKNAAAVSNTGWTNNTTDDNIIPSMSFMAYWNGAYSSSGGSNLLYCDRGRFGTIVTKSLNDYAAASHTHSYLPLSGGTLTGTLTVASTNYSNFNEGIRIQDAANKWAGITFGATGTTGCSPQSGEVAWFVAKRPGGQFIISPNTSDNTVGITLNSGGNMLWRNSVVITAGNIGSYTSGAASSVAWANITGKPDTYTPASHNHDGRYTYIAPGDSSMTFTLLAATARSSVNMIYAATDNPTGAAGWCHTWSQAWTAGSTTNWISQISLGTQAGNGMWYRCTSGNIAGLAWKRVLDSSNYSSYALPLSGGLLAAKNTWLNPAYLLLLRADTTTYTDRGCIGITDGNLHIDPYQNKGLYLNYYSSGGNVYFNGSTYYINGGNYNGNAATATTATTAATATTAIYLQNFTNGYATEGTHDCNAILANGLFYYNANGPATSLGASSSDGGLYVLAHSVSWMGQIALDYRNGNLFVRSKKLGVFQPWKKIMNEPVLGTLTTSGDVVLDTSSYLCFVVKATGNITSVKIKDNNLRSVYPIFASFESNTTAAYTVTVTLGDGYITSYGQSFRFTVKSTSSTQMALVLMFYQAGTGIFVIPLSAHQIQMV